MKNEAALSHWDSDATLLAEEAREVASRSDVAAPTQRARAQVSKQEADEHENDCTSKPVVYNVVSTDQFAPIRKKAPERNPKHDLRTFADRGSIDLDHRAIEGRF